MIILLFICGIIAVMAPAFLLAYFLSRHDSCPWRDPYFQTWAFGQILGEETRICDLPCLWNRRNPEHKIDCEKNPELAVEKMLALYEKAQGNDA